MDAEHVAPMSMKNLSLTACSPCPSQHQPASTQLSLSLNGTTAAGSAGGARAVACHCFDLNSAFDVFEFLTSGQKLIL